MIIDASALLAILFNESDGRRYADVITAAPSRRMPSVSWFEASLALERGEDPYIGSRFDDVVRILDIEVIAFTAEHAQRARQARRVYGRGRHPARLNFGDCMAYAVAKMEGQSLLFKGDDFSLTDIEPALKD